MLVGDSIWVYAVVISFSPILLPVKAGGKRVVSKHKGSDKPDSDAFDQKYIDQLPEQSWESCLCDVTS